MITCNVAQPQARTAQTVSKIANPALRITVLITPNMPPAKNMGAYHMMPEAGSLAVHAAIVLADINRAASASSL